MSLLDSLDPILRPWAQQLLDLAQRAGVHPKVTSARRTYAEQAYLYQSFKEGSSRLPAAPPGTSAHEWGLAFDMVVPNPEDQADLGLIWRRWGGVYGGSYDPVHYEYPGFRTAIRAARRIESSPPLENIEHRLLQLVDLIVAAAPSPLRGILSTAVVANEVARLAGSPYSGGIEWMLQHPAELTELFLQAAWATVFGKGK